MNLITNRINCRKRREVGKKEYRTKKYRMKKCRMKKYRTKKYRTKKYRTKKYRAKKYRAKKDGGQSFRNCYSWSQLLFLFLFYSTLFPLIPIILLTIATTFANSSNSQSKILLGWPLWRSNKISFHQIRTCLRETSEVWYGCFCALTPSMPYALEQSQFLVGNFIRLLASKQFL